MIWKIVVGIVAAVVLLVGAGAAYIWFSGGSGEPSTAITAPPITSPASEVTPPTATVPEATTSTEPASGQGDEPVGGAARYQIVQEQSTASFRIREILSGEPNVVVGVTDQVAAELLVDLGDPSSAQLGIVVINARTFATDNSLRDRAIRGQILDSAGDEFEFITFEPTAIDGIPDVIEAGQAIEFSVTGHLTIRTITQPVTFAVSLAEVSSDRIVGEATAMVTRASFELTIPQVPRVAGVEEDVELALVFVAEPVP